MSQRKATFTRKTKETDIIVELALDGTGNSEIGTGIGFFDHMLSSLAKHALFDLKVRANGDLHVDFHHLVEDVGICLGRALNEALGDKAGVARFGHAIVPMDEALVLAAVDLSGRAYLRYDMKLRQGRVGEFDVELVEEFFKALAFNAQMNLHLLQLAGRNRHHIIEAAFKAVGISLKDAVTISPRTQAVPSTKGTLTG